MNRLTSHIPKQLRNSPDGPCAEDYFSSRPLEELTKEHMLIKHGIRELRNILNGCDIRQMVEMLKPQPPPDGTTFWSNTYSELERRRRDETAFHVHLQYLQSSAKEEGEVENFDEWLQLDDNHRWPARYLARQQLLDIVDGHLRGQEDPVIRENLVRVFRSTKPGPRTTKDDTKNAKDDENFEDAMIEAYNPNPLKEDLWWEPVLSEWLRNIMRRPVRLFPWHWRDSAKSIFKDDADLFSPRNGLFLLDIIEEALQDGVLAIVPDIESSYANLGAVKDYKIVIIDPTHPTATEIKTVSDKQTIHRLVDLDGRRLRFQTDFRPDPCYVFWAFLSAVSVASWRRKNQAQCVVEAIEAGFQKAARCWGTPFPTYVRRSVLDFFVLSVGERLMGHDLDDEEGVPDPCGVAIVAFDQANKRTEAEMLDDNYDSDSD